MKIAIITLATLILAPFVPAQAAADYYLKIDGVEGETKTSAAPTRAETGTSREEGSVTTSPTTETGSVAAPATDPQEASLDAFIKIDGVEGESEKKGNVEVQWKVEEGESARPGSEGLEIAAEAEALTPDFSILLGGGSDDDESAREARSRVADILLQGMQEGDMSAEQVSMNFEKITTRVRQGLKLFGLIPVSALATVEIDAEERVTVKFPWWAFLASGKDASLGERVFTTLSNVLTAKHDTVKNAINNVR